MKNTEVIELFSTPIIKFRFEKHDEYNDKWDNWDVVKRQPRSWQCELNTSFPQVQQDDPYAPMEAVNQLQKDLLFQVKKLHKSYGLMTEIVFYNFWYNAYYAGQGQEWHNHLPEAGLAPIWSGVYFAKNCLPGQFAFQKTDLSMKTQGPINVQSSPLRKYYDDNYITNFVDGDVVLFPPHLNHCVKLSDDQNVTDQRLTFSFNADSVRSLEFQNELKV
jgi:hypothetical protein